ncbi:MAG: MarR family winged helix-turn-helix transcriptional regulator [Actinomycetota bacterium]
MTDARWLDAEEQATWRAFLSASRAVFEELDRQLQRDAGMPLTYYEVLARLSEADGRRLRMHELARLTGTSRSRLSHAVSRLEARGWVARRDCPEDGRGAYATLTDEGFEALREAAPGHVEAVRTLLFDPLTAEQVTALRHIGEQVLRAARPDLAPPPAAGTAD